MPTHNAHCPHCGTPKPRLMSDQQGTVGWCQTCFRTWVPSAKPRRPTDPHLFRKPMGSEWRKQVVAASRHPAHKS